MVKHEVSPADGLFPTTRWKAEDWVKLTFSLRIPPAWQPGPVQLSLRVIDEKRTVVGSADLGTVTLGKGP